MKYFLRSLLVMGGLTAALNATAAAADCCKSNEPATCCGAAQACCPADPTSATPAAYPLETCVVSGEKLGSMGAPYDYVHKQEGKPDRIIRLCCKGCVPEVRKDPAKHLQLLDDAAAAQAKAA